MNINKHDAQTEMEMNMTPMIDVVFLLIIFFMIITDLTQQDLEELKLPEARSAIEDKPDPKVVRPIINMCVMSPPLTITREQIDDMVGMLREGILRAMAEIEASEKGESGSDGRHPSPAA